VYRFPVDSRKITFYYTNACPDFFKHRYYFFMSDDTNLLYLSVMGTMGSGKTTAARLIAKTLRYHLVEENFGENAFLPRFYKRMNRWAFHSQTFFLMEKINQLMEIRKELTEMSMNQAAKHRIPGIVQDTPIEQDVFSYAKAQHALGNMDDAEWRLYRKIYDSFEPHLPKPDIIFFLDTSIGHIQERIEKRGRGYEEHIPTAYLQLLDRLNHDWIKDQPHTRIVPIQTDGLNIVTSKHAQEEFLSCVRNAMKRL